MEILELTSYLLRLLFFSVYYILSAVFIGDLPPTSFEPFSKLVLRSQDFKRPETPLTQPSVVKTEGQNIDNKRTDFPVPYLTKGKAETFPPLRRGIKGG
jgi:hypothetical protein